MTRSPRNRLLLSVIVLLAVLLRCIPLTAAHFWDETVYLQHARIILDGRTNYDEFDYRPPLLPIFYAGGLALWDNLYVANLVQGVLSGLTTLFGFLAARRTFGSNAALIAAALLAFTPSFVASSHALLTDMPAVTALLAAMWLYDRPGPASPLLSGIASALAAQFRFTSLFGQVYYLTELLTAGATLRRLVLAVTGTAIGLAPYLFWVRWNYESYLHSFAFASRITREWTLPVPARFYLDGLGEIFPVSLGLLFVAGAGCAAARWAGRFRSARGTPLRRAAAGLDRGSRRILSLVLWGGAYFTYMATIPHKEVRYLLPLAIPVVIVSAAGAAEIWQRCAACSLRVRLCALALGCTVAWHDYGPTFDRIVHPWIDGRESGSQRIARYLREIATPTETLYAVHDFPVLAFYSELTTVSLLPIQEEFAAAWRTVMKYPGYFVWYRPAGIRETHARNPVFKPDRSFLDTHPEFRILREFPDGAVYRYTPSR